MLAYVLPIYMIVFWFGGLYEIMWEYAGMRDVYKRQVRAGSGRGRYPRHPPHLHHRLRLRLPCGHGLSLIHISNAKFYAQNQLLYLPKFCRRGKLINAQELVMSLMV